jgi:hypothetical protein
MGREIESRPGIHRVPVSLFQEWRRVVGRAIKPKYERYVELNNKKAVRNNYTDYGHAWRARSAEGTVFL